MRQALTMDVLATDLADYLVRKGVGELVHTFTACCDTLRRFHLERHTTYLGVLWPSQSPEGAN
jgi:hypothetical protein